MTSLYPPRPRSRQIGRGHAGVSHLDLGESGQALVGVKDEAGFAHLAVGDDVDAGLVLPAHHFTHSLLNPLSQLTFVNIAAFQPGTQQLLDGLGPGYASDMGSQDPINTGFQGTTPNRYSD